jgi:hypothetical protein
LKCKLIKKAVKNKIIAVKVTQQTFCQGVAKCSNVYLFHLSVFCSGGKITALVKNGEKTVMGTNA